VAFQTPITIARVLDGIHRNDYVLPAIQREFVWRPGQICRLFDSLMTGYPVGSFLFWSVQREHSSSYVFYQFITNYHELHQRHLNPVIIGEPRDITAILDGQQRLTALNVGLYGSHAEKLPRLWWNNPKAYPVRFLYLNIAQKADDNEMGMEYDFRFLTPERASLLSDDEHHWFRVSEIRQMAPGKDVFNYVRTHELIDDDFAFDVLSRLHDVVHKDQIINYFKEESQDLDKVLNIFIRVNSGGTQLSYSDLLLSIATAQWRQIDAREVIHGLVDELNRTGQGFNFSKDLVLKAGLMLSDIPSVAFRVTNFNARNMAILEDSWYRIADALRLAVELLSDFGFSQRTLTADSVVIPVAYYLAQREADESFRTSASARDDRRRLRTFVYRSIAKPGIWGSGLDTLLTNLRATIRDSSSPMFPVEDVESAMARLGKSLRFDLDEIEDLLDLSYNDRRTFSVLALLYPGMNFRHEFHVDHIFSRNIFNRRELLKLGVPEDEIEACLERVNRLGNLQLLEGPVNVQKGTKLPKAWMEHEFPEEDARNAYRTRNDLGELPEDVRGFISFYDARRERMKRRLHELLGTAGATEHLSEEELKLLPLQDEG
jgi:hypothetical protein